RIFPLNVSGYAFADAPPAAWKPWRSGRWPRAHRAPVLHVHHPGALVDLHLAVDNVPRVADPVLLEVDDEGAVGRTADGRVLDVAAEGLEIVPVPEERRAREARARQRGVGRRVGAGQRPELDESIRPDGDRVIAG